ncbi:MAG TPA: hypothetical protein VG502_00215 [Flexivirga sp.]|uniref:hypothetical protein n=1 Tax=Flexivirga sp. TaxID=1962927 RepID=UPI002B547D8F|nr:hypothetical protein [Flexivirga sp.]HWC20694.1 hypothetical protein [Flexivirga sp.]
MIDPPGDDPQLAPISWQQKVFIDTHKAAIEKAIESADDACGAIVTACFALATAYGAAITVLTPKDSQPPAGVVILPLLSLVLGAMAALIGKSTGISLKSFSTTGDVREAVKNTVKWKRILSISGVVAAGVGVVGGLLVLI